MNVRDRFARVPCAICGATDGAHVHIVGYYNEPRARSMKRTRRSLGTDTAPGRLSMRASKFMPRRYRGDAA